MEDILKVIKKDQSYDLHEVIPECPTDRKRILFWDKSKSDQLWTRPYQMSDGEFLRLSGMQQDEIMEIENERCANGVWFYNFGEPTYLTGDAYNFLTYYRMEGHIIPEFMKFQLATFYFYLYAERQPSVYGTVELKPRREGCTHRKLSIALNRAIMNESFFVGIQSKTGKDAAEVCFGNIVKAYNRLPVWRKPKIKLENPSRELAFEEPPRRKSNKIGKNSSQEYDDYYLQSRIDHRASASDAYDGEKLHIYIGDEFWKWTETNADTTLSTIRKCLVDGEDIIGMAFLLSTTGIDEKEESAGEDAFNNGLVIWNGGNPHERNSLGETENGLLRFFISAYNSRRGTSRLTNTQLLDKYGNVNESEAKKVILAKRENEKDPRKKMVFVRQEPMNVQEAITSMMGSGATFDNYRIGKRRTFLENYEPTDERPIKYIHCNLGWKNNERFSEVIRVESEEPRFKISYLPDTFQIGYANRIKTTSATSHLPFSDTPFMMGADPFNYAKTVSGEGSKGTFHIKHKYMNRYALHYSFRPASPDLFFEDMLLAAWYYGAKINPERSGSDVFNWFKRQGCYSFIINRPDITKNSAFTKSDTEKGTTPSPENIELGCNLIENFLAKPNEEENENIVDNLDYFWDEETLKQLMEFDKKKREKYDSVMAMIHTEIGSQSMKKFLREPIPVSTGKRILSPIDIYTPKFTYGQNGTMTTVPHSEKPSGGQSNNFQLPRP